MELKQIGTTTIWTKVHGTYKSTMPAASWQHWGSLSGLRVFVQNMNWNPSKGCWDDISIKTSPVSSTELWLWPGRTEKFSFPVYLLFSSIRHSFLFKKENEEIITGIWVLTQLPPHQMTSKNLWATWLQPCIEYRVSPHSAPDHLCHL